MRKTAKLNFRTNLTVAALLALFICLIFVALFIAKHYIGLNESVEYERSVFISQIAERMKSNIIESREYRMTTAQDFAAVVSETRPESFDELRRLFPKYTSEAVSDQLFLLSSDCNLYGIDGIKKWASLPYEDYFLDILANNSTTNFIRIGVNREFMVFSAHLPSPVEVDGIPISAILLGWDSVQYRAALSSKLFEEKSSSLLVEMSGNIVIYPTDDSDESYGYNIFTYLTDEGMLEDDLAEIRELLTLTEDSTFLTEVDGKRWLFSIAYYDENNRIFIMLPIQNTSSNTYQNLYGLIAGVVASFLVLFLIVGAVLLEAFLRQREQREKELQTELLMKTTQAKNDFLAKMSHDIRTPLNGIIGMNYIASTKAPQECTEVIDCLDRVDSAAKYLLGILNNILDMSKIENDKLTLSANPFSLDTLISEIELLISFQMEGKNFDFIVDAPQSLDYDYIGDELRLKQVLINLISNAVKFTELGQVVFAIKILPADEETDEVIFTIADTGHGMSPEFMEHLFTPFAQEDNNISSKSGGSGLGLAIAKSFVDLMDGTITVSSTLGKGSEFTVTLLLKKTAHIKQEQSAKDAQSSCRFEDQRALLCEDNDLNAEIAKSILESFGLTVDRAEDGKLGVEFFERSAPGYYSIIFMDVRMPQMDGYKATRTIRSLERPDAAQIPICALSANAFSEDIHQSMDAGMNVHLSKPLDISQLLDVLKKFLKHEE